MAERKKYSALYRIVIGLTSITLIFFGALLLYWGLQLGKLEIIKAQKMRFLVFLAVLAGLLIIGLGLNPLLLIIIRFNKCHIIINTVVTFAIAVILITLAIMTPMHTANIPLYIQEQCSNKSSSFWTVDYIYQTANSELCQEACPCNADISLWNNPKADLFPTTPKGYEGNYIHALLVASGTTEETMSQNQKLANNYQDCKTLQDSKMKNSKGLGSIKNYDILKMQNLIGAIEYDLDCAGLCTDSYIYTFSKVERGPPHQNCSMAAANYAKQTTKLIAGSAWGFGILCFICSSFLLFFSVRSKEDCEDLLFDT